MMMDDVKTKAPPLAFAKAVLTVVLVNTLAVTALMGGMTQDGAGAAPSSVGKSAKAHALHKWPAHAQLAQAE